MSKVIVLGSINIDMVMKTERFPRLGETILGSTINYFMGGKGANQAVACTRAGSEVVLFASVGNDAFGGKAFKHLRDEGINTSYISVEKNVSTGIASIYSMNSDNAIVVLPGANMHLQQITKLSATINSEDIFLTQLEIPLETVEKGLLSARKVSATTILNPAPFNKKIMKFIGLVDIITPNETEFEEMVGYAIHTSEIETEMIKWSEKYDTKLIVTRGSRGVSYVENQKVISIPTINVEVADTTGAGDTFNGVLAALLAEKSKFHESVRLASACASISTTKVGAQTGMPYKQQLLNI